MSGLRESYETPKWRTFWLLVGFALIVGIGVVTVLLPELEDEPDERTVAQPESGEVAEPTTSAQE